MMDKIQCAMVCVSAIEVVRELILWLVSVVCMF